MADHGAAGDGAAGSSAGGAGLRTIHIVLIAAIIGLAIGMAAGFVVLGLR